MSEIQRERVNRDAAVKRAPLAPGAVVRDQNLRIEIDEFFCGDGESCICVLAKGLVMGFSV